MLFLLEMEGLLRAEVGWLLRSAVNDTEALVPNAGRLRLLSLHSSSSAECHNTGEVQRWLSAIFFALFLLSAKCLLLVVQHLNCSL